MSMSSGRTLNSVSNLVRPMVTREPGVSPPPGNTVNHSENHGPTVVSPIRCVAKVPLPFRAGIGYLRVRLPDSRPKRGDFCIYETFMQIRGLGCVTARAGRFIEWSHS